MHTYDFSQRRLFSGRHYKLERNGIAVTEKSWLSSHTFHVPFENIPPKAQEITTSPRKWLVAASLFSIITLVVIPALLHESKGMTGDWSAIWFWGGIAFVCWIGFFLQRKSLLVYSQDRGLFIMEAHRPTTEAVGAFVRKMFQARNQYLRSRYGQFAPQEPLADRLNRLELLRNQEVLLEEEYQVLRRQQMSDSAIGSGPIGFRS